MTNPPIRWGVAILATILAEIALIALSILCVAVYSYAVHTGETQQFYNQFAQASGPWVSLIAGGPVFFLLARWIRGRSQAAARATAMAMCVIYLVLEVVLILAWPGGVAAMLPVLPLVIIGFVVKFGSAWIGAGGTPARASEKVA